MPINLADLPANVLSTTQVHQALGGIPVPAKLLIALKIEPAVKLGAGTYWHGADVPQICDALITHLRTVRDNLPGAQP
jgi:hypothetical protein